MHADPESLAAIGDWSPYLRLAHDFPTAPGFTLPARRIVDHALLYVAAGVGDATIGGRRAPLTRGDVMVLPPGVAHAFAARGGSRLHLLNLHFDPIRRPDSARVHWHRDARAPRPGDRRDGLTLPTAWRRGVVHRVSMPAAYERRFYRVLAAYPAVGAAGELRAKAALGDLMAWLHDDSDRRLSAADDAVLDRARAAIDRHAAERLSVAAIAAAAGVGRSRLALLFRRRMGVTPMAYLRRVRIERAMLELAYHGAPVKTVAQRAGFASVHHFTRVFTREVGIPPAAWQRSGDDDARRR